MSCNQWLAPGNKLFGSYLFHQKNATSEIWGILWTCGHGNKYVFSSASIYILYLWVCTTSEQKGVVVGGGNETAVCCGSNVLLPSTRSILLACVLRLPFILFSVICCIFQFYGPLFQWAAYKISKHIWFYLDTTGTHTVFRQQLCSDSI